MKKVMLVSILMGCLAGVAQAQVDLCVCYTDHVYVNQCLWVLDTSACWYHDNPYPGDYEAALANDLICDVTLKVKTSDIGSGDVVKLKFWDAQGNSHELGFLGNGDNEFPLDPAWLDSVQVKATLCIDSWRDWCDTAKIVCSDLTVCAVPLPGAVLLGLLGLSAAGLKLRRRA